MVILTAYLHRLPMDTKAKSVNDIPRIIRLIQLRTNNNGQAVPLDRKSLPSHTVGHTNPLTDLTIRKDPSTDRILQGSFHARILIEMQRPHFRSERFSGPIHQDPLALAVLLLLLLLFEQYILQHLARILAALQP